MKSVLQDWVMQLPLRHQGTLLTVIRGCDLVPKYPLDSLERNLTSALRHDILNPADAREIGIEPGCFFNPKIPAGFKWSALGHYPWHWVSHVIHSIEILGYKHPNLTRRGKWNSNYENAVYSFHLKTESENEMDNRLTEDRIVSGTVVS